jgi:H+/Cl- antiporter ClcA
MNKLPVSARILITLCFIFACLMGVVSLLAVVLTASDLGGRLPLRYFEQLNFPVLTILFPVVGMLMIGVIALVLWLKEARAIESVVIENVVPAVVIDQPRPTELYTKAA